jgi:hypothetical protein
MIKTISDYPLVAGEILRRNQARKSGRGLSKYWLRHHPYCEVPSKTGAPTCMNRSTTIIYFKQHGIKSDPQPWFAACDECFNRVMKTL